MPATRTTSRTYERISLDKWNRIKAKAEAFGLAIPADEGTGSAFGILVGWKWVPQAPGLEGMHNATLTVSILESLLMDESDALDFLDQIIQST